MIFEHHAEGFIVVDKGLNFVDNRDEKIRQEVVCRGDLLGKDVEKGCSNGAVANRSVESESLPERCLVNEKIVVEAASSDSIAVHGIILRVTDRRCAFLTLAKGNVHWTRDELSGESVIYGHHVVRHHWRRNLTEGAAGIEKAEKSRTRCSTR